MANVRCFYIYIRHGNRHFIPGVLTLKCEEGVPSLPLTYQEKRQLKADIDKLPGHKLGQLMNFIQAREPSLSSAVNEIEVDIEMLRPSTLRALQSFVAMCLKKSSKSVHSKYTSTLSDCSSANRLDL